VVEEKNKKATKPKKMPSTNRYRLANVIFSESVRPAVLQYGRALTKEHLESNLKPNQKIYELVALEYNKGEVKEYSEFYFDIPFFPKNLSSNFSPIMWKDVKFAWNESFVPSCKATQQPNIVGKEGSVGRMEFQWGLFKLAHLKYEPILLLCCQVLYRNWASMMSYVAVGHQPTTILATHFYGS
jgi:hypothetical protein